MVDPTEFSKKYFSAFEQIPNLSRLNKEISNLGLSIIEAFDTMWNKIDYLSYSLDKIKNTIGKSSGKVNFVIDIPMSLNPKHMDPLLLKYGSVRTGIRYGDKDTFNLDYYWGYSLVLIKSIVDSFLMLIKRMYYMDVSEKNVVLSESFLEKVKKQNVYVWAFLKSHKLVWIDFFKKFRNEFIHRSVNTSTIQLSTKYGKTKLVPGHEISIEDFLNFYRDLLFYMINEGCKEILKNFSHTSLTKYK